MSFLIKISDFKKRYKTEVVTIKNTVLTKRVTLLVGPNGSGKSTLLKAIAGFIRYKGVIDAPYLFSYSAEEMSYPEDITFIDFYNNLIKLDNSSEDIELFAGYAEKLKLSDRLDDQIKHYSKGMKMKATILIALTSSSDIYLLDEPLTSLDKESVNAVKKIIKNSNKMFIIATHMKSELLDIADEVIYLDTTN